MARSKLVQPKAKDAFTFKVPEKLGVYPFVCTFPSHAALMNGRMHVSLVTPGLTGLKFALYQGKWEKLPDFKALTPHREGEIQDGLIEIKLDDYMNHFGIVYTGKLKAPKDGDYTFSVAGDDGVRLLIDGKMVVENDGIHAITEIKSATTKLTAGMHDVRVEYFQAEGELGIYVAWKGADFQNTTLTKWLHPGASVSGKVAGKKIYPQDGYPAARGQ